MKNQKILNPRNEMKRKAIRSRQISNLILLAGSTLLVFTLIYLLMNLNESDMLVKFCLPIIVTSILLVFVSQLFIYKLKDN